MPTRRASRTEGKQAQIISTLPCLLVANQIFFFMQAGLIAARRTGRIRGRAVITGGEE